MINRRMTLISMLVAVAAGACGNEPPRMGSSTGADSTNPALTCSLYYQTNDGQFAVPGPTSTGILAPDPATPTLITVADANYIVSVYEDASGATVDAQIGPASGLAIAFAAVPVVALNQSAAVLTIEAFNIPAVNLTATDGQTHAFNIVGAQCFVAAPGTAAGAASDGDAGSP